MNIHTSILFTLYTGDVTSQMSQTFLPSVLHRLRSDPTATSTNPMPITTTPTATGASATTVTTTYATTTIPVTDTSPPNEILDNTSIPSTSESTPIEQTRPTPTTASDLSSASSSSPHNTPEVIKLPPTNRTLYYSALLTTISRLVNVSLLIGVVNSTVAYFLLTQGARVSAHFSLLMCICYVCISACYIVRCYVYTNISYFSSHTYAHIYLYYILYSTLPKPQQ